MVPNQLLYTRLTGASESAGHMEFRVDILPAEHSAELNQPQVRDTRLGANLDVPRAERVGQSLLDDLGRSSDGDRWDGRRTIETQCERAAGRLRVADDLDRHDLVAEQVGGPVQSIPANPLVA